MSLLLISNTYRRKIEDGYIVDNEKICNSWMTSVDSRLNLIHYNVHEALLYLNTEKEFTADLSSINPFTSKKIVDYIHSKRISSNDITAFFLYDINSNKYFYEDNSQISRLKSTEIKTYLKAECINDNQYIYDEFWNIKNIDGSYYYYETLKLGRFLCGVISDCGLYDIEDNPLAANPSSFFILNDEIYFMSGNSEYKSLININDTSTLYRNDYVISYSKGNSSGIIGVIVTEPDVDIFTNTFINIFSLLNAFLCITLVIILYQYMKRNIFNPSTDLIEGMNKVSNGNLDYRLNPDEIKNEEFNKLFTSFNYMTSQIDALKVESYDMKLKEEQNRLIMLRAQVRPHTFLNCITTISNMTYDNDSDKMRDYIYEFSQFTRYMLHTNSEWSSIKSELENIKNYIQMQKIRFPNSIELTYECDEEIENFDIPFLILFTMVENSFKHAMSLVQTLHINIKCEKYETKDFKGVRLIEEDDGDGFPSEVLFGLNENNDLNTKEHIGLTNVRYTLNLLYGRKDLLRLSNKENGGAKVEMLIPERK